MNWRGVAPIRIINWRGVPLYKINWRGMATIENLYSRGAEPITKSELERRGSYTKMNWRGILLYKINWRGVARTL